MPYTNVQFIGYVIDTAPQVNPDGSQTYLGLADPRLDGQARCELMQRAMETAAASLPQASPPEPPGTTLKVFVAPEFFFRGPTGAYQMDDVQLVIAALQRMAAQDKWADWVFAFGTIVGVSSPAAGTAPGEIYNFCLVQQGGVAAQGDAGARVVMKELKSNIDFIADHANPGGLLIGQVDPLQPSRGGGPGREMQQVNYDGAGIFQLQGITWALDICLDHGGTVRRLVRSPQMPGDPMVQLQLVPSCGMSIQEQSAVVESDGLVFNCDGLRDTRHSQLARQLPPLANIAMASSTPVPGDPLPLDTSPPSAAAVASLYASGPGVINCYAPRVVPPARTVGGTKVDLCWPASDEWTFNFTLVYAANGAFAGLMCEIVSRRVDFRGNWYYLPLGINTTDSLGQPVRIYMIRAGGSSGYAGAVRCHIDVPGFRFEGNAFQFSALASGPAPETAW